MERNLLLQIYRYFVVQRKSTGYLVSEVLGGRYIFCKGCGSIHIRDEGSWGIRLLQISGFHIFVDIKSGVLLEYPQ